VRAVEEFVPSAAEGTSALLNSRNTVRDSQDDDFVDTEMSLTSNNCWSIEIWTSNKIVILSEARHEFTA
jgi:hypothetical protein